MLNCSYFCTCWTSGPEVLRLQGLHAYAVPELLSLTLPLSL